MYDLRDEADIPVVRGWKAYHVRKRSSMRRRAGGSEEEEERREEEHVRSGRQTGQEMLPEEKAQET